MSQTSTRVWESELVDLSDVRMGPAERQRAGSKRAGSKRRKRAGRDFDGLGRHHQQRIRKGGLLDNG